MRVESLVLIEDDDVARRLIATFELAAERFGPADVEDETFVERWAAVSGTDIDDVVRLWPLLFENGFLHLHGMADAMALEVVRSKARATAKKAGVKIDAEE